MKKKMLTLTYIITICTTILAIIICTTALAITLALKNEFFFSIATLFVGLMFVCFVFPDEIEIHEADDEKSPKQIEE